MFLGLITIRSLAIVYAETRDQRPLVELFSARPVFVDAPDKRVAWGQGRFLLQRVDALPHEDVAAAHAGVEGFELDF